MNATRFHQVATSFQFDDIEATIPMGSKVLIRVRPCGVAPSSHNTGYRSLPASLYYFLRSKPSSRRMRSVSPKSLAQAQATLRSASVLVSIQLAFAVTAKLADVIRQVRTYSICHTATQDLRLRSICKAVTEAEHRLQGGLGNIVVTQ